MFGNNSNSNGGPSSSWAPIQSPPGYSSDNKQYASNHHSNNMPSNGRSTTMSSRSPFGSMSFPKQSSTFNFSPAGGFSSSTTNQNNHNSGFSFSNQSSSPAIPASFDGSSNGHHHSNVFNNRSSPSIETRNIFPTSSSTTPSFQSPFQSNSFLSRPSPKSLASPSSPYVMSQQSSDLASSTGLRRRVGTTGGVEGTGYRPPLPSATRLGVSMDAPDDFKENWNINKVHDNVKNNTMKINGSKPFESTNMKSNGVIGGTQTQNDPPQSLVLSDVSATDYKCWVIIYGFTNSLEYKNILASFETFGTIVDKYPSTLSNADYTAGRRSGSSSNWVCIKYKSSIQADKAICQHGSFMHIVGTDSSTGTSNYTGSQQDNTVIVGVMRMDERGAMRLGLKNYLEFGSTGVENVNKIGQKAIENDTSTSNEEEKRVRFASSTMNEDDILLLGNDRKRSRNQTGSNGQIFADVSRSSSACEKFLAWFFNW